MSLSKLLTPKRNSSAFIHGVPSSSFISDNHSMDCFAVRIPPAALNPTAMPVSCAYSRIARVITKPTGSVALVSSLPVDLCHALGEWRKSGGKSCRNRRNPHPAALECPQRCFHKRVINADGGNLDIQLFDSQPLYQVMLNWLPRFCAKPAYTFLGVIARERCEIHARDGPQQPCRLPILLHCPASNMSLRPAFDGTGVNSNLLQPIEAQRNATIR